MPVPIMPQNVEALMERERAGQKVPLDYNMMDLSGLSDMLQKQSRSNDMLKVGDNEAKLLFNLWKENDCTSSDNLNVPKCVSNTDIIRLIASGLISGGIDKVRFTPRGREVITTMVLSEENALSKTSSDKTYEQRTAEVKPKRKNRFAGEKS
ncbi:MAG: hypothetical protein NTW30_04940 [Candidatus Aenigmarchaeota archaeon]|nr:hypothetical protein [Candidatus Aenigmarchaeota archaeon]